MLSIGVVSASGGRYYTDLARNPREDYYSSGGESPGTWHKNRAADAFGFRGEVNKEEIERLFDGYHPRTGEALAQNHGNPERRAALDLCMSAPKDVSTLWAVSADPERRQIEEALDRAVDRTLRYVSDQFGYARRGHGGYEREKIDNLLVAKFTHRQSRGQDPQLHTHSLVLNTSERADGSFGTIDATPLLYEKKNIGAYFRSALAHELGISLQPDEKTRFSFRIPGVPEELSERWSSRAKEIEAEARARNLPQRGEAGSRTKAFITLETRRAKDERPLSEMKPEWQETARGYGFGGEEVAKIFSRRRPELTPEREAKLIDKVIEDTVTKLTSQQAHFTRSNLVQGVCMATVADGISPERIHERAKVALQGERFVALGGERERYTTKEIFYDIEQKALDVAERLGEKATHMVRERTLAKEIARKPRLNEEQRAAVETVCRGPDLTLILGPPGSGKSTLLEVARKAIEKEGGGSHWTCPLQQGRART